MQIPYRGPGGGGGKALETHVFWQGFFFALHNEPFASLFDILRRNNVTIVLRSDNYYIIILRGTYWVRDLGISGST